MAIDYAETYSIPGDGTYGIEDYTMPGDHFFPGSPHKRFRVWHCGGGLGQGDTLDEARAILHAYALSQTRAAKAGLSESRSTLTRTVERLGNDVFNLGQFLEAPRARKRSTA